MAIEEHIIDNADQYVEFSKLKQNLQPYRALVLFGNSLLKWEKFHYPVIIFIMVTGIYMTLSVFKPPTITLISLALIGMLLFEVFERRFSPGLFKAEWNDKQESKFDDICFKLYKMRNGVLKIINLICRPATVVGTMTVCLTCFIVAWIGAVVNNFLIMYLLTLALVMSAGISSRFF